MVRITLRSLTRWVSAAAGILAFSVSLYAQGASGSSSSVAPGGDAETGKKLYQAIGCWQCHGYSGQGAAGSRIAPDPMPLPAFTRYIRKPTRAMPPYSPKVVTDAQLADIYAFLLTIPKPPDADSIPLLKKQE